MKRTLVIACGAAETRGALLEGENIVRLFFADDSAAPFAGETREGRIAKMAPTLGGAFVDIGADRDAFLPFAGSGARPTEGAQAMFIVRREGDHAKGAIVAIAPDASPAARLSGPARVAAAAEPFGAKAFIIDRPGLLAGAVVDSKAVLDAHIEDAIADALSREVALQGGGRLVIDETEAVVAVDVDSGAIGSTPAKAADETNEHAVRVLFRALALRGCGGRLIVDFLPPSSARAREALLDACRRIDASLFPRRAGRLAPDGLFDFTALRSAPSVLARASVPVESGAILRGRRLTPQWRMKRAIAALEDALARRPSARLTLAADPDVVVLIESAGLSESVSARFGARFDIIAAPGGLSVHDR